MSALDEQIGGSHYKKDKIQIWHFCEENQIPTSQGLPMRYIRRFKDKAGLMDLKKAKHCIDLLIEHYYKNTDSCEKCNKTCHGWSEKLPEINCKCECHQSQFETAALNEHMQNTRNTLFTTPSMYHTIHVRGQK